MRRPRSDKIGGREKAHVPDDHGVLQLGPRHELRQHSHACRILKRPHRTDHGREKEHRPQDRHRCGRKYQVDRSDHCRHCGRPDEDQARLHPIGQHAAEQRQEHAWKFLNHERARDCCGALIRLNAIADEERYRHDLDADPQRHHHRRRQPRPVVAAREGVAASRSRFLGLNAVNGFRFAVDSSRHRQRSFRTGSQISSAIPATPPAAALATMLA